MIVAVVAIVAIAQMNNNKLNRGSTARNMILKSLGSMVQISI